MARKLAIASLALGLLTAVVALDAGAQKKGGVLRVGIIGEPPALDVHWTTAALTADMSNHLYEEGVQRAVGVEAVPQRVAGQVAAKAP